MSLPRRIGSICFGISPGVVGPIVNAPKFGTGKAHALIDKTLHDPGIDGEEIDGEFGRVSVLNQRVV